MFINSWKITTNNKHRYIAHRSPRNRHFLVSPSSCSVSHISVVRYKYSKMHKLYFFRDVIGISLVEINCDISRVTDFQGKYELFLKSHIGLFGLTKQDTSTQTNYFPFLNMYGNLFQMRPRKKMQMCVNN